MWPTLTDMLRMLLVVMYTVMLLFFDAFTACRLIIYFFYPVVNIFCYFWKNRNMIFVEITVLVYFGISFVPTKEYIFVRLFRFSLSLTYSSVASILFVNRCASSSSPEASPYNPRKRSPTLDADSDIAVGYLHCHSLSVQFTFF